jgi:metallophosphoesterase (TIGR00282 family)
MRLGFFGDVVGRSGRDGIAHHLPGLKRRLGLEFVVVNAENAANGFGITEGTARELFDAGADCLTLGNHSWDQKEALTYIVREPRLLRPVNYPRLSNAPGAGAYLYETPLGKRVLVVSALGRVYMDSLDDPFSAVDRELEACPLGLACDAAIVDIHAEITSEKMAMGHFCDGRASLVVGTHTTCPTADAQILPAARPSDRCGRLRRLRQRDRHAEGGAAAPLHRAHPAGPQRARQGARHGLRRVRGDGSAHRPRRARGADPVGGRLRPHIPEVEAAYATA